MEAIKAYNVESIRADFPILKRKINGQPLVYLDNAASTQKPQVVIDAITNYYTNNYSNIHRGVHTLSQEGTELYERTRGKIQRFINAQYDYEVIFTKGTTDSINLVAYSFGRAYLKTGDEILITGMEHHSNIVPWQLIAELQGAVLKYVPIKDNGSIDIEDYKQLLSSKTKIVSVSYVSNSLGTVNPVNELIKLAKEKGAKVLLDAAQAIQHIPIDVQALDVDFLAFSGHKIYGPTGTGILYGKEELLNRMPPFQGGGDMIKEVTLEETTYNDLPFKFEAGTPNIAGMIGLGAAIDYIKDIGVEAIAQHEEILMNYLTQELDKIDDLVIIGTAEHKAGAVSFIVNNLHPYDIGVILDNMGIAIRTGHHCTQPIMDKYGITGTCRASFGLYNTKAEIDLLIEGLKKTIKMLLR